MASAPGSEPGQAGSPPAQENGLREGAPSDSEGLQVSQALDLGIPETSKFLCAPSPAVGSGFHVANIQYTETSGPFLLPYVRK